MKTTRKLWSTVLLNLTMGLLLAACGVVSAAEPTATPRPTDTPLPAPADTATPPSIVTVNPTETPTVEAPTSTPVPTACLDRAHFVSDVTIPDGTKLLPGTVFVKTWRLQNLGSCEWGPGYTLVFVGGEAMQAQTIIWLPGPVAPGGVVDLSVTMTAPARPGGYRSEWKLRNADGQLFGIGRGADEAFWAHIVVPAPATATAAATNTSAPTKTPVPTQTASPTAGPAGWRGEYFTNRHLAGSPVLVRDDGGNLDLNWGAGAPAAQIPADNFSVRWTRVLTFSMGTYRFRAMADDGVRLWVDEQLVIDDWKDGGAGEVAADVSLAQGAHSLRVEFYEAGGDASFKLWWESLGSPAYPDWKGEYWPNRQFSGSPALVRNDRAVNFDWGLGAAAPGLPADDFAARWSRWVTFEPGDYRFYAVADDGVRLYIDGRLILDEWHENDGVKVYTVDRNLTGPHAVLVEYYDRGWRAMVKVWWERLKTPTPTPTFTPTPTATPTTTTVDPATASVSGQVWQDVCALTGKEWTGPGSPPAGCVGMGNGTYIANGVLDAGEAGINRVVVALVRGACAPNGAANRIAETITNAAGQYAFGGLAAGDYCLIVDPADPINTLSLGEGLWTNLVLSNRAGAAYLSLTLLPGEAKTNVRLGWDYVQVP